MSINKIADVIRIGKEVMFERTPDYIKIGKASKSIELEYFLLHNKSLFITCSNDADDVCFNVVDFVNWDNSYSLYLGKDVATIKEAFLRCLTPEDKK